VILIANCAVLRVPVDTARLFDGDEDYEIAIAAACDRVAEMNRVEAQRMRAHG